MIVPQTESAVISLQALSIPVRYRLLQGLQFIFADLGADESYDSGWDTCKRYFSATELKEYKQKNWRIRHVKCVSVCPYVYEASC